MAQEIQVLVWCDGLKVGDPGDFIPRHDPKVSGSTRTFALDGGKPKHVDLCDPCNSGLTLDELREALRQHGVSAEAGKSRLQASGAGNPAAIAAKHHISGVRHGRPPGNGNARKELCLWCPMDYTKSGFLGHIQKAHGFSGVKDALGHTCPRCGQDGLEMVSVHISRSHPEFESATAAFIWARDNGDTYGVYAERRAAGERVVEAML